MLMCCFCCFLRIIMMFIYLETAFDSETETGLEGIKFIMYILFSRWIPFFGLASMMVYVTSRAVQGSERSVFSGDTDDTDGEGEVGLVSGEFPGKHGPSRIDGAINMDPDPGSETEDKILG